LLLLLTFEVTSPIVSQVSVCLKTFQRDWWRLVKRKRDVLYTLL